MESIEAFQVPLIVEVLGERRFADSFIDIAWRLQGLAYENGYILDLTVPIQFPIGSSAFFGQAVPGIGFGHQVTDNITASAPKFGLAAGVSF